MKSLLIAIDFDGTFTAAPDLWTAFIVRARADGHRVVCVTCRRPTRENQKIVDGAFVEHGLDMMIYFTGLSSKTEYMKRQGVKVDIWIDDSPETLVHGH